MVGLSVSIETGIKLAREGKYKEAIKVFDEDICFMHNDLAMSSLGSCMSEGSS